MNPKKHNRRRQPVHLSLLISHRRALLVGIGQIAQSRLWSPDVSTVQMYRNRNGSTLACLPSFNQASGIRYLHAAEYFCKTSQFCPSVCPGSTQVAWVATFVFTSYYLLCCFGRQSLPGNVNHTLTMYVTISTSVLMWITIWPSVCDSLPSAHAPSMRHNLKSGKKRSVNISCHDCASVWHPSPTPFS